jgi:TPR repeat protein
LLLGIMYKTGAGVPLDAEYAVQLFGRACDDGETLACVSLGYMYANGEGVDRDQDRAQELFRSACASADRIGCQANAQLEQQKPVP